MLQLHLLMSGVLLLWSWMSEGSQSQQSMVKISLSSCDVPLAHTHNSILFPIFLLVYQLFMPLPICVIFFDFLFVWFAPLSYFINLGRNSSTGHDPTYIFIRSRPPQCSTSMPTAVVKAVPLRKAVKELRKADAYFSVTFFYMKIFTLNVHIS